MKKLNITYDTAEIENGEKIVGEACYTVEFADDRVADRLLDHGTSGVAVAELEKLLPSFVIISLGRIFLFNISITCMPACLASLIRSE